MTDNQGKMPEEAVALARCRVRRLIGLSVVCAAAICGAMWLAPTPGTDSTSPATLALTDGEMVLEQASLSPLDPFHLKQTQALPDTILRPTPIPLPSAGLGGMALLVVMALWRRANLRQTTRLH